MLELMPDRWAAATPASPINFLAREIPAGCPHLVAQIQGRCATREDHVDWSASSVWSLHADYSFAGGCDEPFGAGDGRCDPLAHLVVAAGGAGVSGAARAGSGSVSDERVEPSGVSAGVRDRRRGAGGPQDTV